jgi:hypothetical protein
MQPSETLGGVVCPEKPGAPYLSVVATARNDDHGGNLIGRMQVFVSAWINQCKRHNLSAELILVEWNPPADKPPLAEALRWPADTGPCEVRIIQVSRELHGRYRHAAALPLYQMIAKNAGVRRARGEFVLCTNIDIVFSDEIVRFLAERKLQKGRMYRVDRHDIASDIPIDGTLDEQLAYARSHVIRLCAREEIFALTSDGLRENEAEDITPAGSQIYFGKGWFKIDRFTDENFRWIGEEAEIFYKVPSDKASLVLEVEPGPGVGAPPVPLQVRDRNHKVVAEWMIEGRTMLRLAVPKPSDDSWQLLHLYPPTGGHPIPTDPRLMNMRVFRCDWIQEGERPEVRPLTQTIQENRPTLARYGGALKKKYGTVGAIFKAPDLLRKAARLLQMRGNDIFDAGADYRIGSGWHHLEKIGDLRFRWGYYDTEIKICIHDGPRSLAFLVESGPTIGFRPFDLVVRLANGEVIGRLRVDGLTYVEMPLPVEYDETISVFLNAEGGGSDGGILMHGDSRTLNFRVIACGRGTSNAEGGRPPKPDLAGPWAAKRISIRPEEVDWQDQLKDSLRDIARMGKPAFLHINACGDFTLMHRDNWFDVRGYAELDQFSMHLDSMFCYASHHLGILEEVLPEPMRIYHIEHAAGSGFTPEGQGKMYDRIAKAGIQVITYADLIKFVTQMRRMRAALIFNLEDWGLALLELNEQTPAKPAPAVAAR